MGKAAGEETKKMITLDWWMITHNSDFQAISRDALKGADDKSQATQATSESGEGGLD